MGAIGLLFFVMRVKITCFASYILLIQIQIIELLYLDSLTDYDQQRDKAETLLRGILKDFYSCAGYKQKISRCPLLLLPQEL